MTDNNQPLEAPSSDSSITITCLLNGDSASHSFSVNISATDSLEELKGLIKSKKTPDFDDSAASQLVLWKVSIPTANDKGNENYVITLNALNTKEKKELLPADDLSEVFGNNPPENTIHVIVQRPPRVPELSNIMLKVSLKTTPRRELSWIADVKQATLKDLITLIYDNFPELPHPSQSNDNPRIAIHYGQHRLVDPPYPTTDKQLQAILQICIEQGITSLIVDLETPTKTFSTYNLNEVDMLYGLTASCSGYLSDCQAFQTIGSIELSSDELKQAPNRLYQELEKRIDTTLDNSPIPDDEDISTFVAPFLHHATGLFKDHLRLTSKRQLSGCRGHGQADFLIESRGITLDDRSTELIVTETKRGDFASAVAQNMVQLESALAQQQRETRKRKRNDDDDGNADYEALVCYGIVTDASCWHFVECKLEPATDTALLYPKFRTSLHAPDNTKVKLFCLIDGDPLSRAFSFQYEPTADVDDLRNIIMTSPQAVAFNDIAAFQLTLWRASVSMTAADKHKAILLDTLDIKEELLPSDMLSEAFLGTLPTKMIHIIIQRPPQVPKSSTTIPLKVIIKMESKRELAWIADPNVTTLQDLRSAIFENHPDLKDDHATITIRHPKQLNHPSSIPVAITSDNQFRLILQAYGERNITQLTLDLDSPSKSYSSFSWTEVQEEYGVSQLRNYNVFSTLHLDTKEQKQARGNLWNTLEMLNNSIGIPESEADASMYVACFVGFAIQLYKGNLRMTQQKELKGRRGHGPVDYALVSTNSNKLILGVVEVKFCDMNQGLAQNVVQLESALTERWRTLNNAPGNTTNMNSYGIVTTASLWTFVQCTLSPSDDPTVSFPTFHYSRLPVTYSITGGNWRSEAEDIFKRILWLVDAMS
ncbi:hypothetical protein BG011_009675, partial [Mortierella polycephala]